MKTIILGLSFLFLSLNASAFKFSPMSASMNLEQKENRLIFNLENESTSPVAVEISLKKRVMKLDGSEDHLSLSPDEGLSVYPEQLVIPPSQKRSVRVSYSGKKPPTELAYRLIAEQLPVELEQNKLSASGIKMLMRYIAAIYIDPGEMKADVHPISYRIDQNKLVITLENKGNKHQLLKDLQISFIKDGKTTLSLDEADLAGILGENILAQTKREFTLPNAKDIKSLDSNHQIQFRLKP